MSNTEEEILIVKEDEEKVPKISAHRAFLYSAALPGWGEKYAGAFGRASLTGAFLCLFLLLFFYAFFAFLSNIAKVFTSFGKGVGPRQMTEAAALMQGSVLYVIVAIFGIYFVWLWALISSVEVSRKRRIDDGGEPQNHPLWAMTMSYFCPGSGHVYIGETSWGYCLFGACLVASILIAPSGLEFMEKVKVLYNKGANTQEIMAEAAILTFGMGTLIGLVVQYLAITETAKALNKRFTELFKKKSPFRLFLLALVNYCCPGAAHVLVERTTLGFQILYTYLALRLTIGLLMGIDMITPAQAQLAAWFSTIVQWAAVVEAPVREFVEKETNSADGQSIQSEV